LVAHRDIALEMGVQPENAFVLEDGNVLELTKEAGRIAGTVTAGHIYVDGLQLWDMKSLVLRDRRTLSRDGMVVVTLAVDKATGRVLGRPEAVSSGFVDMDDFPDLMARTAETALRAVDGTNGAQRLDWEAITAQVKDSVGSFLYEETRLRPLVIPVPVGV
jgi:ribonuclease J